MQRPPPSAIQSLTIPPAMPQRAAASRPTTRTPRRPPPDPQADVRPEDANDGRSGTRTDRPGRGRPALQGRAESARPSADPLARYRSMRDFRLTAEPAGEVAPAAQALRYVIQKHHARRLHYDFRLELDGTLKSWAVPRGPSFNPANKRLAVEVEDHPLEYRHFSGDIPAGQYGAGHVDVWDRGSWTPKGDPHEGLRKGRLHFILDGEKLRGAWVLVRTGRPDRQPQWLLFKEPDEFAVGPDQPEVVDLRPEPLGPEGDERDPQAHGRAKQAPAASSGAGRSAAGTAPVSKVATSDGVAPQAAKTLKAAGRPATQATAVPRTSKRSTTDGIARGAAPRADVPLQPADLPGARKAPLPAQLTPQLATLVDEAPEDGTDEGGEGGGPWRYEVKFDGYRLLARICRGKARLVTRSGQDWTHRMPELARALATLPLDSAWVDGEIVVFDDEGQPSFQRLQQAFEGSRDGPAAGGDRIVFMAFDLPHADGWDLTASPCIARRTLLGQRLAGLQPEGPVRFSADLPGTPQSLLSAACGIGLEGLIGKRADAPYTQGRARSWIKLKCRKRQEFIVIGYTAPRGSRVGLGALLLALHDDHGVLRYAGRCGSGFDGAKLMSLHRRLQPLVVDSPAVADLPAGARRATGGATVHWVRPELVAEIEFAEQTDEGLVRHAVFQGLREDKPASQVGQERALPRAALTGSAARQVGAADAKAPARAKPAAPVHGSAAASTVHGIAISHASRVIDPTTGLTKGDIARYLEAVAPWLAAELADRPVSLLRVPDSITDKPIFQKHLHQMKIPGARLTAPELDTEHEPWIILDRPESLVGAAQAGAVEFHAWNARAPQIEKPDRFVLDLDPDPSLPWRRVVEAAELTRTLLDELGLVSFLKTTGGKGLHVVVPIQRRHDWDTVKGFSQRIAAHLAATLPDRFSAKMGPKNRVGKIFVDYLRNGRGATAVSAYSPRARPGLPVSMPIHWDQARDLEGGGAHWTVREAPAWLAQRPGDPWEGMTAVKQTLTQAMRRMDVEP